VPKPNPVPGGSHIKVGDRDYTFGAIGFDFYYSGELAQAFPFRRERFITSDKPLTADDIARIQNNMSDCSRPEMGLEYRQTDSTSTAPDSVPDPFGIDHSTATPAEHTVQ
jgi:hypothetical protein